MQISGVSLSFLGYSEFSLQLFQNLRHFSRDFHSILVAGFTHGCDAELWMELFVGKEQ